MNARSITDHDRALADVIDAAAVAIGAARRLARAAEGPWVGALLAASERLAADARWYERDVDRRRADEVALKKEQDVG